MNEILGRSIRPFAALALGAALLSPAAAPAQTAPSDMLGTWSAPSGALKTVTIAGSAGAYTIHVTAPCSPTPCDWGTRPLTIYAPSVSTSIGKSGSATYNQGFVTRTVIVTLQTRPRRSCAWTCTRSSRRAARAAVRTT